MCDSDRRRSKDVERHGIDDRLQQDRLRYDSHKEGRAHEHRTDSKQSERYHGPERKRKDRDSAENSSRTHRSSRHQESSSSHSHEKRHRHGDHGHRHRHHHHRSHTSDRPDRECEANKEAATDTIPTSDSLSLTSSVTNASNVSSALTRDEWMTAAPTGPGTADNASANGTLDDSSYFSSLGQARVRAARPERPDPEKLKISSRELNTQLVEGKSVDEYQTPSLAQKRPAFGAPGHQWRMMKLKRTFEAAQDESRDVFDVALERYASLEEFEYAKQEREYLDGKGSRSGEGSGSRPPGVAQRSFMLASGSLASDLSSPGTSRPGSRQGFRRPGESSNPATPTAAQPARPPRNIGFDTPSSKPSTPSAIPSVFTPVLERSLRQGVVVDDGSTDPDRPILPADQLNKLQAKILKAELMGDPSVEELKQQFEHESARSKAHKTMAGDQGGAFGNSIVGETSAAQGIVVGANGDRQLQVLPTLDARGRMYDVGSSATNEEANPVNAKGKRAKQRDHFEARDSQTGKIVRYSADDDSVSLGDLVRAEKFSAGSRTQKDLDAELAANIMTDAAFSTDLDAQDDEAHRYARKKMKSDALKRQFAINDFAKTKKVLDTCRFCWQDEGARPPRATVISTGYRAYLAIPDAQPIVEGHTLIVPMQHHLSSLEADQDTWDEIKNFVKCLIQLAATRGQRMVFFETVLSLKHQSHTVIEAVPVPERAFALLPGVFKESLRSEGGEFSSNSKIVAFTPERPFRKSLVANLPYFAVSWDPNFATGYGHVIEDMDKDHRDKGEENAFDIDELGSSSGFSKHFARQVISGVLIDSAESEDDDTYDTMSMYTGKIRTSSDTQKQQAKKNFVEKWDRFDWTKMLQ